MEENPKPPRWYRFSLRTMLVLVTVVCIFCCYLGWAMNWKRQREVFRQEIALDSVWESSNDVVEAPWSLRILGEKGVPYLVRWNAEAEELIAVSRLFPEARVLIIKLEKDGLLYETNLPDLYHTTEIEDFPYYKNGVLFQDEVLKSLGEIE